MDPRREVQRNLALSRAVFSKWGVETLVVLYADAEGAGFEALRREIGGISPRVLSHKLKTLEGLGLVHRTVLSTRPPRVNYTLTKRGQALARMAEPIFLYLDRSAGHREPAPSFRSGEEEGGLLHRPTSGATSLEAEGGDATPEVRGPTSRSPP